MSGNNEYIGYLKRVQESLVFNGSDIYHSKIGNERLAREVGWCLKDFGNVTAEKAIRDSYNYICVIGYSLNPYLDKK